MLLLLAFQASGLSGQVQPVPEKLINFKPDRFVRFDDLASADKRRADLIQYVWQDGLPADSIPKAKSLSKAVFGKQLSGIDPKHAKSVLELECEMKPYRFIAICYLIKSSVKTTNNDRLLIVHSGHRQGTVIGEGVDETVEKGLEFGFNVLVVDMPLVGWNQHNTVTIPASKTMPLKVITIGKRGTSSHNDMFRQLGDPVLRKGTVFRFFVEPVVQGINYFLAENSGAGDVSMVGLSGGGWTTHFCAAIDVRIKNSFPVAGAMPLYARRFSPGSWGDHEQNYEAVYGEKDTDGDGVTDTATGVASWLEIFALGGIGEDRHQIQILNINDPCCFSTEVYKTYDSFLKEKVQRIGAGRWGLFSDRTHKKHIISEKALDLIFETVK